MHYGTPPNIESVEAYYTHIRRGRTPDPHLLADLIMRYEAIGGPSPLTKISEDQAKLIQVGLTRRGIDTELFIGTKHTHPFVAEAVKDMADAKVTEAVGIVLAPHFSGYSIAQYKKYATDSRDAHSPEMKLGFIERWGAIPEYIDALCDRVRVQMEGWDLADTLVIFSAHSLPVKAVANGDPYQEELLETSRLVAEKLEIPRWTFAFQSQSQTGEPWLGPDILDVIEQQAVGKVSNVLSCTVGFVSDHLEVLYDLGIETRDKCAELGLNFHRAEVLNADEKVMDALAAMVAEEFKKLEPVQTASMT